MGVSSAKSLPLDIPTVVGTCRVMPRSTGRTAGIAWFPGMSLSGSRSAPPGSSTQSRDPCPQRNEPASALEVAASLRLPSLHAWADEPPEPRHACARFEGCFLAAARPGDGGPDTGRNRGRDATGGLHAGTRVQPIRVRLLVHFRFPEHARGWSECMCLPRATIPGALTIASCMRSVLPARRPGLGMQKPSSCWPNSSNQAGQRRSIVEEEHEEPSAWLEIR